MAVARVVVANQISLDPVPLGSKCLDSVRKGSGKETDIQNYMTENYGEENHVVYTVGVLKPQVS